MQRYKIYPSRVTHGCCAIALLLAALVPWLLLMPLLYQLLLLAATAILSLLCACYLRDQAGCKALILDDSGDWLRHSQGLRFLAEPWHQRLRREFCATGSDQAADQLVQVTLTPLFTSRFLLVLNLAPVTGPTRLAATALSLRWWILPDSLDQAAQRALRRRFRLKTAGNNALGGSP